MENETPRNNLRLHQCRVEKVHGSGLCDARSERDGAFFEQINMVLSGAEGSLQINDKCVVISDGAQHFVMGGLRDPQLDESGETTVRNINNDLSDLRDAKSIHIDDEFGNQARVVVSKGGGVIVDGGEVCVRHYSPADSKILDFCDRYEFLNPAATVTMDHNGINAEINYKFRTLVDPASLNRDMEYNRDDALDLGGFVTMDIKSGEDLVEITTRTGPNPLPLSRITIGADGSILMQAGPSGLAEVEIKPNGTVDVRSSVLGNAVQVQADGRVYIGGLPGFDLKQQLDQLLDTITQSQTVTLFGPQFFIPANAIASAIKNATLPSVLTSDKE